MAEFRCPEKGSRKASLFSGPSDGARSQRVAVAAPGSVLRGTAEPSGDELWLCVPLADSNPLRAKRGLLSCYVRLGCVRGEKPRRGTPQWVGPSHVKSVNSMLDLQWERPFYVGQPVTYTVDVQPEGGEWGTAWTAQIGEEFGSARIEVTLGWPCRTSKALLRLTAASGPFVLTSTPLAVHGQVGAGGTSEAVITTAKGETCSWSVERMLFALTGAPEDRTAMLNRAAKYEPRTLPCPLRKRIVLRRPPGVALPHRPLRKALIMGLYHSCSSAMATELRRRFDLRVVNVDPRRNSAAAEGFWKHGVLRRRPPQIDDETLVVLMVKEPYFWMKSMARCFYQAHPLTLGKDGLYRDVATRELQDLFGHIEHDQVIYPNAAALWNDAVTSYLDDTVYPPQTSAVVRAEDFLFSFDAVMDELGAMGLQERSPGAEHPAPLAERTKVEARSRDEALVYYSNARNRREGFSVDQLLDVDDEVDETIKELLGYGADAMQTWLPTEVG